MCYAPLRGFVGSDVTAVLMTAFIVSYSKTVLPAPHAGRTVLICGVNDKGPESG